MIMVMEDLRVHVELQDQLLAGDVNADVARNLGHLLGCVHRKTHSALVSEEAARHLTVKFANRELRQLQLEQFFTQPYQKSQAAAPLRSDVELMSAIDELKAKYKGERTDNLSLCHGDFHAGSVLVERREDVDGGVDCDGGGGGGEGISVKVIDPEFAIYGPPGLDVGCLISGYVLACVHRAAMGANSEQIRQFHSAVAEVWNAYESAMRAADVPEAHLKEISSDVAGFAGCEVARNAIHGLPIDDKDKKASADEAALALAVRFIKGRARGVGGLLEALEGGYCALR
jgi:5-methylthioribose kinase